MLVPHSISDDSILRIARNHRQGRFPVAVWRHQYNKATLLRAGGIERSTIGSIMRQTKTVSGSGVTHHAISSSASVEQEKYFAAVGRYPLACKAFPCLFSNWGELGTSPCIMWLLTESQQTQKDHTEFYKILKGDVYQAKFWTRYSHSKSPKIFDNNIYILRHQATSNWEFLSFEQLSLVQIGFHKDQYTLSDFVVLVLCCVILVSTVLEMSRKGDLMKSMNNATDFATYLIALFEFLHEGKTDTFKG